MQHSKLEARQKETVCDAKSDVRGAFCRRVTKFDQQPAISMSVNASVEEETAGIIMRESAEPAAEAAETAARLV